MKVAFRTDASLQIGTGHVMRCLTLADGLAAHGAECQFLCRAHDGNLIAFIRSKGYRVHVLPAPACEGAPSADGPKEGAAHTAHHHWLGGTLADDIDKCASVLTTWRPDWLIVDHYALDVRWERALAPHYGRLMAIDDLADRPHGCDVLLDQTFGRQADDYDALVPSHCQLLCGSQYALLRPEFAALRPYSLQRRVKPELRKFLISMGGVDKDNAAGEVLTALRACALPADCGITVVMGETAPWRKEVERQAAAMPWHTQVRVGVSDMAQLMADSDLAIGAAGATSWERCCLGLPSIMIPLAANQIEGCKSLVRGGAGLMINISKQLPLDLTRMIDLLQAEPVRMTALICKSMRVVDGLGMAKVINELVDFYDSSC